MFILEIVQRHLLKHLLKRAATLIPEKGIFSEMGNFSVEALLEQGKLFMMMLFMLGWNKHINLVDTILRNQYVYTYKNKSNARVDYRIEGFMLLAVFVVKIGKGVFKVYKEMNKEPAKIIAKSDDHVSS